jgi:hypothetical protein
MLVGGGVKVLPDAIFEVFGLADIENVAGDVVHYVHAGVKWKIG